MGGGGRGGRNALEPEPVCDSVVKLPSVHTSQSKRVKRCEQVVVEGEGAGWPSTLHLAGLPRSLVLSGFSRAFRRLVQLRNLSRPPQRASSPRLAFIS